MSAVINPNRYFVVVRFEVVGQSGVEMADIRRRLCSGNTWSEAAEDFIPGQATSWEYDGRFRWLVTRTNRPAPDPTKRQKLAFVVKGELFKGKPALRRAA